MSRILSFRLAQTMGVLAAVALSHPARAEEGSVKVSGTVGAYGAWSWMQDATDLVPSPSGAGYHRSTQGLEATLQISAKTGALTFASQLRVAAEAHTEGRLYLDEAYVELPMGQHVFAFAGRRILTWGQSYGLNPADVFQDPLRENNVFRQSEARTRIEGVDMIGADVMFDSGNTLTLIYAPGFDRRDNGHRENFAFGRLSGFAFDGALDYAVSVMGGDRPGVGVSLNYALGDASVIYLDGVFRKGRDRQAIAAVSPTGTLSLDPIETDDIYPYVTLGFGHTFGSGVSLNLEYTHDGNGYSGDEWDRIAGALDDVTPVTDAIRGQSLGQINGLLNHYTLRQNYAFARLAHDGLLGGKLAAELIVLHGMDDGSGVVGLRLEHPFAEQMTVGLKATQKYGGQNREFTLRPETDSIAIYTSIKF